MFKRIVVAIDGSPTARRGFETALALAADQGAALYVLHVIDSSAMATASIGTGYVPVGAMDGLLEAFRDAGNKVLRQAEMAAKKRNRTIATKLVDSRGSTVADAIVAESRKLRADLIVLGTHGRRGLRRMVMGSDAEGVVRDSKVPVLLVRAAGR